MLLPHTLPTWTGRLKDSPEDFRVTEVPAYEAAGEGDHILVEVTKVDLTTPYLMKQLAAWAGIREDDIGFAGMKDRRAVTTQRLSFPAAARMEGTPAIPGLRDWRVLGRHPNKLKRGHLTGNSFELVVQGEESPEPQVAWLHRHGFANYYGSQRFGREDNVAQARDILAGRWKGPRWKKSILLSAWQSDCFNQYLQARIAGGLFETVLEGDVCQKLDSGGVFWAEDADLEQPRLENFEISPTGPLPGFKMRLARGPAAELEAAFTSDLASLRKEHMDGTRRALRLPLQDFSWEPTEGGWRFRFFLPSGSYATVLMAHIFRELPEPGQAPPS